MALEHPSLITAWLAHHLDLGADRIHLFVDENSPNLVNALPDHPSVTKTTCNANFWQTAFGGRPNLIAGRQRAILQQVLNTSPADFVFHIDIDEFLVGPGRLSEHLAMAPLHADSVVVSSMERVYLSAEDPATVFAGAFRRQNSAAEQRQVDQADGDCARFLFRGMTAYAGGKSGSRTRRGLKVGVHYPRPYRAHRSAPLWGWNLLHFDGLTAKHWTGKRLRVLRNQPNAPQNNFRFKAMQLSEVSRLVSEGHAPEGLYHRIKELGANRAANLADLGLLATDEFDPRPTIERIFPGHKTDLSCAAIDGYDLVSPPQ